jgi:hypothetical protein
MVPLVARSVLIQNCRGETIYYTKIKIEYKVTHLTNEVRMMSSSPVILLAFKTDGLKGVARPEDFFLPIPLYLKKLEKLG